MLFDQVLLTLVGVAHLFRDGGLDDMNATVVSIIASPTAKAIGHPSIDCSSRHAHD